MDGILMWLAAGVAGLLFVALVVAWWEHLGRTAARHEPEPPAAPARSLSVDVDLDALPEGDVAQRREVLGSAIERMTQPGALQEARKQRWIDTAPMVGPGPARVHGAAARQD